MKTTNDKEYESLWKDGQQAHVCIDAKSQLLVDYF